MLTLLNQLKKNKKTLIDDLSKRLLELEFKSNHSITFNKVFKMGCQKYFTKLKKIKSTQSEIKPILKIGKGPGATYCLAQKDFAYNFMPQEV